MQYFVNASLLTYPLYIHHWGPYVAMTDGVTFFPFPTSYSAYQAAKMTVQILNEIECKLFPSL